MCIRDSLSAENRGVKTYVGENEDLELKLSAFASKIAHPAVSDLKVRFNGVDVYDVFPRELPDLFYGQELAVYGRFKGEADAVVIIEGKRAGENAVIRHNAVFRGDDKAADLPRLWATQKIAQLLEDIRIEGETQALKDEVVRLARKYGVITPYTSMLVLEDEEAGRRPRILSEAVQAGSAASGIDGARRLQRAVDEAKMGFREKEGGRAVEASKSISDMAAEKPSAPGTVAPGWRDDAVRKTIETAVKRFPEKTFYLVADYWQDADFDLGKHKVTEVRFLSEEYFELLKQHPGIGQYLALGDKVIVLVGGRAWKIMP